MMDLHLTFDWTNAPPYGIAEYDATFADFAIHVGDSCVTAFTAMGEESARVCSFLRRPLYPVAEWLACNWWTLLYEASPSGSEADGYSHRHNLRYARDGFALPDVEIWPRGNSIHFRWTRMAHAHSRTRFVADGEADVGTEAFERVVADFLDAVNARLQGHDITATPFQEEWHAIQSADDSERAFCIAAARRGWYPYGLTDEQTDTVLAAGR